MNLQTKINAARAYGSIAYAKGLPCAAAADPDCMALLDGMMPGEGGARILAAWSAGWVAACLAAETVDHA